MKLIQVIISRLTFLIGLLFLLSSSARAQGQVWTLEECIQYALEHNIQVQQQEINQKVTYQDLKASKFDLLPDLNGFASHGYNFGQSIDPFTNQFASTRVRNNSFSLSTNFVIFNGFRKYNTIQRNKSQLKASQYDVEKMKNDISLNVANAYLRILFNKELLKNAENQLSVTQLQIDRIKKQVAAGALPEGALKDIQAQKATEELQKVNAENDLVLSKLNLAQMLRLENVAEFDVADPELENFNGKSELLEPKALYGIAMETMPEVKSAELNLFSAEKSTSIARAAYLPSFSFRGSLGSGFSGNNREVVGFGDTVIVPTGGFTSQDNEQVLTQSSQPIFEQKSFGDQLDDNFNRTVSFTLNIPIFNGMSARTSVQRAKLQRQSAELNLENTKLQLRQDIETAHADALAALKRFQAAEKSVEAIETSFSYTEERFRVGLINSFEYNNEKNRLNNARSELLQAKYNYIFSTKVLDFYQGKALTLD